MALIATMIITSLTGCGNKLSTKKDACLELGERPQYHTSSFVDVKDEETLEAIEFDFSKVNYMKVGEYDASATYKKKTEKFKITVEDTTSPEIVVNEKLTTGTGVPLYASDIINSVTELSGEMTVSFKDSTYEGADTRSEETTEKATEETTEMAESTEAVEGTTEESTEDAELVIDEPKEVKYDDVAIVYDTAGEYDNTITLEDASGNIKNVDIHVIVTDLPVIKNASDIIAGKGSQIDYLYGITANDSSGNDLTGSITVDSSAVDTRVYSKIHGNRRERTEHRSRSESNHC